MAKRKEKSKRGRPPAAVPLKVRMLVRFDEATAADLAAYSAQTGIGSESTAVRVLAMEGLRRWKGAK